MVPLPSVNQAYGMILEEETQRTITSLEINASSLEGIAVTGRGSKGQDRGNFNLEYSHCLKKGQLKDNCFQLIGCSANFRVDRGKQARYSFDEFV